jgi:hypothetical protein
MIKSGSKESTLNAPFWGTDASTLSVSVIKGPDAVVLVAVVEVEREVDENDIPVEVAIPSSVDVSSTMSISSMLLVLDGGGGATVNVGLTPLGPYGHQ